MAGTVTSKRDIRKSVVIVIWMVGLLAPLLWAVRMYFGSADRIDTAGTGTKFELHYDDKGRLDISRLVKEHCNRPMPRENNAAYRLVQLPDLQAEFSADPVLRLFWSRRPQSYRTRPWTTSQAPEFAAFLDQKKPYLRFWCDAMTLPGMSKPLGVGVSLWDIRKRLLMGIELLEYQTLRDVGEQRWDNVLPHLQSMDRATQHFAKVQGGWVFSSAVYMYERTSELLARLVLATDCPKPILDYVRQRTQWNWKADLRYAMSNALRIQSLDRIERRRDDTGFVSWLNPKLHSEQKIADLQRQKILNSIDWTVVAQLNNQFVDDSIDVLETKTIQEIPKALTELRQRTRNWIPDTEVPGSMGFVPYATEKMAAAIAIRQTHHVYYAARQSNEMLTGSDELTAFCVRLNQFRKQKGRFPNDRNELSATDYGTKRRIGYTLEGSKMTLRKLSSRRIMTHTLNP